MSRSYTVVLFLILILIFNVALYRVSVADSSYVGTRWVVESDPSSGNDASFAVCISGDYIYVVGYDSVEGDSRFRIEKRFRVDGSLVDVWSFNPSTGDDWLMDCVVVDRYLYAVGFDRALEGYSYRWVLVVLDTNLSLIHYIAQNITGHNDWAISIDSDGAYLYIAGFIDGGYRWYVEKRDIENLEVVATYVSQSLDGMATPFAITVDPNTSYVWVGGFVQRYYMMWWRVEILDRDLNIVRVVDLPIAGSVFSIAFDDTGYIYVIGDYGVVKLDRYGYKVKETYYGICRKALFDNGYLYIVCNEYAYGFTRHVLYVLDEELEIVNKIILSGEIHVEARFPIGRMSTDGKHIYVAGYCGPHDNERWIIYSIDIEKVVKPRITIYTYTVKEIERETITKTTTVTIESTSTTTVTKTLEQIHTQTIEKIFTTVSIHIQKVTETIAETKTHTYVESITRTEIVTEIPKETILLYTAILIFVASISILLLVRYRKK
ncbi:MAG: hypothetical protein QXW05_02935 [Ignisphaera sp.]